MSKPLSIGGSLTPNKEHVNPESNTRKYKHCWNKTIKCRFISKRIIINSWKNFSTFICFMHSKVVFMRNTAFKPRNKRGAWQTMNTEQIVINVTAKFSSPCLLLE